VRHDVDHPHDAGPAIGHERVRIGERHHGSRIGSRRGVPVHPFTAHVVCASSIQTIVSRSIWIGSGAQPRAITPRHSYQPAEDEQLQSEAFGIAAAGLCLPDAERDRLHELDKQRVRPLLQ
jgi:hypothetical protein